jgi:methyl-accepting chemotaxis protein
LFDEEDRMLHSRESGDLNRRRLEITAVGVSLLVSLLLTPWVARRISRNVASVATAASQLAAGDHSSRADVRSRDEIGVMANAFNTMAGQMADASLVITSSAGRLNAAADELATDDAEFVRLTTQQQRSATSQVAETMEQLSDVSRQVPEAAGQIASASAGLATLAADLEGREAATAPA